MEALENGPFTTNFAQLVRAGVNLPAPETLDDVQLHLTMWKVIMALADLGVFIEHTDHLSDRDLYAHLWHHTRRDEVPDIDHEPGESACHVDVLGGGSEEDTQVFLRYYADDAERGRWLADFPDCPMPPHEDPAYDRDRHLPKPYGWH
jgi:hypothetical protein